MSVILLSGIHVLNHDVENEINIFLKYPSLNVEIHIISNVYLGAHFLDFQFENSTIGLRIGLKI